VRRRRDDGDLAAFFERHDEVDGLEGATGDQERIGSLRALEHASAEFQETTGHSS